MTNNRPNRHIASFVCLMLVLTFSAAQFSAAQGKAKALDTIAQMKGTWTATLSGYTGCGESTMITTFTLDATGNGTQSAATLHTVGCGDTNLAGQIAQIQSFNADGSGFIAFGCGSGCGFGFNIQVEKNKQVFNLAPQLVGGNFLAGVAVHK
jgi:hypothetical protein